MYNKYSLIIHGLPVFEDVEELAELLHINSSTLNMYVEKGEYYYKKCKIPKKSGGTREILQPTKEVKAIQSWILRNILDILIPSTVASAYIKGRKPNYHLRPHINNRYFFCVDLEDFFPSISFMKVFSLFIDIGYSKHASYILTKLSTCRNYLPQGAVTSPAISNFICIALDRRLFGYTSRRNIAYTRYADDMTFSSNNRNELNCSAKTIKRIIAGCEFKINNEKTRFIGPKKQCRIIGMVKNTGYPEFRIGMKKKRKMRSVIYHAIKKGDFIDSHYSSMNSINGWLSYLKSVDNESYNQIIEYIKKIS
jgi:RNA-directed DNA polymerase